MPRNGSGSYSAPASSWNPPTNGASATPADWQALLADLAATLTGSVASDGQTPMTGNLQMGGNKVSGLAAASGNGEAVRYEQLTAVMSYLIPAGTMIDFAGTVAPSGFLACDGAAVSRVTYAALFTAIGTTWGAGDGTTTFNVPNMSRRTAVGSGGSGTGTLGNAVGNTGGAETHTLVSGEIPSHNHGVTDPQHSHGTGISQSPHQHNVFGTGGGGGGSGLQGNSGGGVLGGTTTDAQSIAISVSVNSAGTGISIQNTGGGGSHNNMQPSAVVLKCIKT